MKIILLTMIISSSGNISEDRFQSDMISASPISYFETQNDCLMKGEEMMRKLVSSTLRNQAANELNVQLSYSYRCN